MSERVTVPECGCAASKFIGGRWVSMAEVTVGETTGTGVVHDAHSCWRCGQELTAAGQAVDVVPADLKEVLSEALRLAVMELNERDGTAAMYACQAHLAPRLAVEPRCLEFIAQARAILAARQHAPTVPGETCLYCGGDDCDCDQRIEEEDDARELDADPWGEGEHMPGCCESCHKPLTDDLEHGVGMCMKCQSEIGQYEGKPEEADHASE